MIKIKSPKNWLFPFFIFLVALGIELLGNFGRTNFSYQNNFVQNSEYWRLVTGHLTHLGWPHFLLNMAGLILVWSLYGNAFRYRIWLVVFLWCSFSISLGFYLFDSGLQSYVGLSGVLHGLIAAALLSSFIQSFQKSVTIPWEDALVFVGLWCKVIYEQMAGPVPLTESVSGANVVVNAHLYGAISGTIYACTAVFNMGKPTKRRLEG